MRADFWIGMALKAENLHGPFQSGQLQVVNREVFGHPNTLNSAPHGDATTSFLSCASPFIVVALIYARDGAPQPKGTRVASIVILLPKATFRPRKVDSGRTCCEPRGKEHEGSNPSVIRTGTSPSPLSFLALTVGEPPQLPNALATALQPGARTPVRSTCGTLPHYGISITPTV